MAPCSSCSSEVEEWCKFQPCGDVFCLHCTIQEQCSRGNKRLKCPECDEFVTSIEKRKTIIVSKEARSGTKKRIETVDQSFKCHDTDLAAMEDEVLAPIRMVPTVVVTKAAPKEDYLPASFELPSDDNDNDNDKEIGWKSPPFNFTGTARMVFFWHGYDDGPVKFGDKDESNDWDSRPVALPPPPPRQYHSIYGIEYNHGNIHSAIMDAKEGDRVYIPPGEYGVFLANDAIAIDNAIEIIGMGRRPEDTVIYRNSEIRARAKGVVRMINLTIRHGRRYDKWFMEDPCNEPMIRISSRLDGKKGTDLVMESCVIDMGNEEDHKKQMAEHSKKHYCDSPAVVAQHAGAISGIAIESAKSVWISKCLFKGGSGDAIAKECLKQECDSWFEESENEETDSCSKERENEETQVEIVSTRFQDCEEPSSFLKD